MPVRPGGPFQPAGADLGALATLPPHLGNTSGHRQTDHIRIVGLIEAAAAFALEALPPGGAFLTKAFQGGETADVIRVLKAGFAEVKHVKPKASRVDSSEVYLLALGRKRG